MDIRSTGQFPRGLTVTMDLQEDSPLSPIPWVALDQFPGGLIWIRESRHHLSSTALVNSATRFLGAPSSELQC